jgi:DNA-binding protein Fis
MYPQSENCKRIDVTMNSARTAEALAALYEIVETTGTGTSLRDKSAAVLEILSSRLEMRKGAIGVLSPSSGFTSLAVKGAAGEEFLARGDSFLWAVIPGWRDGEAGIAVDTLFGERRHPDEERRFLAVVAAMLAPLFSAAWRVESKKEDRRKGVPLGRLLQHHIAAWMEPMETERTLKKSDLFERLIGEVEKIVIGAALEKTGFVQTEAARFLGINRNTLSKKIRCYGLKKD